MAAVWRKDTPGQQQDILGRQGDILEWQADIFGRQEDIFGRQEEDNLPNIPGSTAGRCFSMAGAAAFWEEIAVAFSQLPVAAAAAS
jgi:hypothetical protein